ncbi:MAG: diguanylate cyclase [Treponema sp.]|nr:diguanylate cyclase [Treponema sp.]
MKEKILNYILYGGITRKEYKRIEKDIYKSNIKNVLVFAVLAFIAYVILYIQVSFSQIMSIMKTIYKISAISYLTIAVISLVFIKLKKRFYPAPYIAILVPLILGAIIGIFVNGNAQTTTFMVFLFAVPLLFTVRPVLAATVILAADLMYIYLVVTRQTGVLLANNLSNAIIYGFISIIFSSYMMNLKIRAIANEKNYKFLIENDQLTGLNNRRSFDALLEHLKLYRGKCTIIEFDINGLKEANDTKGHRAGDELIIAAAECISKTFGKYGKCFRIGGDEFAAILNKPFESEDRLCREFEESCSNWKGEFVENLSVAYGLVTLESCDTESLKETLSKADELMYKNKTLYYKKIGKERRKI